MGKNHFVGAEVLEQAKGGTLISYNNLFADPTDDADELEFWVERLKYLGSPFTYICYLDTRSESPKYQYALFAPPLGIQSEAGNDSKWAVPHKQVARK